MEVPRKRELPAVPLEAPLNCGEHYYERKCYSDYYDLIVRRLETKARCVTVTGTPGIGKSVFYAYFADRYMNAHPNATIVAIAYSNEHIVGVTVFAKDQPPRFPERRGTMLEFINETADRAEKEGRTLLFLCDGAPPSVSMDQTVVFTSPDERWMRTVNKLKCIYYMPLWTCEELQEAARVLGLPVTAAEIGQRFRTFGGEARYCLHPDPDVVRREKEQLEKAIWVAVVMEELRSLLTGAVLNDASHGIVHCVPCEGNPALETRVLASPFVETTLVDCVLKLKNPEGMKTRKWLRTIPIASTLCGRVFEGETHAALRQSRELLLKPLNASACVSGPEMVSLEATDPWSTSCGEVAPVTATEGPYHELKSDTWCSATRFYLPVIPRGDAHDTHVTAKDVAEWNARPENRLLLFQATLAMAPDVSATGLIRVLRCLGLLKSVAKDPRRAALVFVVPRGHRAKFRGQVVVEGEEVELACLQRDRVECQAMAAIPQYLCSWEE